MSKMNKKKVTSIDSFDEVHGAELSDSPEEVPDECSSESDDDMYVAREDRVHVKAPVLVSTKSVSRDIERAHVKNPIVHSGNQRTTNGSWFS